MQSRNALSLVTVLTLLLAATLARADVGLFPQRNVNPLLRFENLDDYPDYNFYLKYGHARGNPGASFYLAKVSGANQVRLEGEGERFTSVYLIAVPKADPQPTVGKSHDMDLLR